MGSCQAIAAQGATLGDGQFKTAEFLRMLRVFRLYEVGVDGQGRPLAIPQRLLDAEQEDLA